MDTYEQFVEHMYHIVRLDTLEMDAIYKDYIIQMVGIYGFNALYKERLIEGCGSVNGRALYVLCNYDSRKKQAVL